MTLTLPDQLASRLREQVSSGRFKSEAEALSAAVELLEATDTAEGTVETDELEALVLAAHRSLAASHAVPFDADALARIRERGMAMFHQQGR